MKSVNKIIPYIVDKEKYFKLYGVIFKVNVNNWDNSIYLDPSSIIYNPYSQNKYFKFNIENYNDREYYYSFVSDLNQLDKKFLMRITYKFEGEGMVSFGVIDNYNFYFVPVFLYNDFKIGNIYATKIRIELWGNITGLVGIDIA